MNALAAVDALRQFKVPIRKNAEVRIDPTTELNFADPDPDIERAFDWLIGFLPSGEWESRRSAVEEYIETLFKPTSDPRQPRRLIGSKDQIAWYLYLVQTAQHEPYRTEVYQASRVLPVFKRLGTDLDQLRSVKDIDLQVAKLLDAKRQHPDSVLFEMLAALVWVKNGWSDVSFVPAMKKQKRPDIRASSSIAEWFVETKRLTSNSAYGLHERDKWLQMWSHLARCLHENRYAVILDITFHVELNTLPDTFLLDQLASKLRLVATPCQLIANETWDVTVEFVDFDRIRNHLCQYRVKSQSPQLQEVIGGRRAHGNKFTHIMLASQSRIGGDRGVNLYVDEIGWAAGAYWHCDAEHAIDAKARGIASQLETAVEQLPTTGHCVVHLGIDTPDGATVEEERYAKIIRNLVTIDSKGKDLRFIYVHLFDTFWPSTQPWIIDETVYRFGANPKHKEPISHHSVIVSEDAAGEGTVHWLRDAP